MKQDFGVRAIMVFIFHGNCTCIYRSSAKISACSTSSFLIEFTISFQSEKGVNKVCWPEQMTYTFSTQSFYKQESRPQEII